MQIFFNVLASIGALGAAVEGWLTWARRGYVAWTVSRPADDKDMVDPSGNIVLAFHNVGHLDAYDVRLFIFNGDGANVGQFAQTPQVEGRSTWLASTQRDNLFFMHRVQLQWRRRPTSRRSRRHTARLTPEMINMGRATVPLFSERRRLVLTSEPRELK
jgi:hypothetical protein